MDRKSILILVISFIVLVLWYPLVVNKLYPPKPLPAGATNTPASTAAVSSNTLAAPPPAAAMAENPATPAFTSDTNTPEEVLERNNNNARYIFTSRGGGLKRIDLVRYPETTSTLLEKRPETNQVAALNTYTPTPTLALFAGPALQGDGNFRLSPLPDGVRAEKTLANGLRIIKEFHLGTNYLVNASVTLTNTSDKPVEIPAQEWVVGTATPLGPRDNGQAVGVMWYDGDKTHDEAGGGSYFATRGFACSRRIPPAEYRAGSSNVVWVAAHNQFFMLAAMPQTPAQAVVVRRLELPRSPGMETNSEAQAGFEAALVYPALTLAPKQSLERQIPLFTGPKEYQTLVRVGDRFSNNIDQVMGYSGFFGFFARGLLLAMNWLHATVKFSYGWAIIAITVIIKLLFWPLTQASTRSAKRMATLQPQMKAIQEKYKDDPVKMNRKTMEFMKEHKVSPLGGCLPMVVQIPVFFGFYRMIQNAIELRGASFLWMRDLSKPDTIFMIPGLNFPFNLLPLIMGATMLWQARLTPPSPGMDPGQAKLMRYMPLMFMVFLYNFSAGLTLYWTVQNLLTIAQTKLTRTQPAPAPAAPVLTPAPKKKK
jgi:YidC/Oxa1 family membrane protein insertase